MVYFSNFSTYFHSICIGSGVPKVIYDILLSQKSVDTKLNSVALCNWSHSFDGNLQGQRIHASILLYSLFFFFWCLWICKVDKIMLKKCMKQRPDNTGLCSCRCFQFPFSSWRQVQKFCNFLFRGKINILIVNYSTFQDKACLCRVHINNNVFRNLHMKETFQQLVTNIGWFPRALNHEL